MNEDLLLRGDQGGKLLNVRRQPSNLVLLPEHAGSEFGDFVRLNKRRHRRRLWEDRHLGSQGTLYFLNRLPRSVRLDRTLPLHRGVLHCSIRERKGFTKAWMDLVLIARDVGKEANDLTPTYGSGIEQDLSVGPGHRPSFIDLLLRWNSINEVDGFFIESWGHLADPLFIRT